MTLKGLYNPKGLWNYAAPEDEFKKVLITRQ